MKKNVLMRAASGLLVATMLTTCAISGTFAKYVTQDNGGDVARVAKWGVIVQVEGDLYSQKYLNTDNVATDKIDTETTIGVNGKQIANTNVVAPGTKSDEFFSFNINGTPEVDSQLTVAITHQNIYLGDGSYGVMVPVQKGTLNTENFDEIIAGTPADDGLYVKDGANYKKVETTAEYDENVDYFTLEDYVVNTYENYYPVVYSLENDTGELAYAYDEENDQSVDTLAAIADAIFKKVTTAQDGILAVGTTTTDARTGKWVWSNTATSGVLENNNDLSKIYTLSNAKLKWEWNFYDDTDADTAATDLSKNISLEDKLDTILGNLMAERVDDTNSTTDFNGEVVKLSADNTSWTAPLEASNGTQNDFCLDTQFNIDILVEQVD